MEEPDDFQLATQIKIQCERDWKTVKSIYSEMRSVPPVAVLPLLQVPDAVSAETPSTGSASDLESNVKNINEQYLHEMEKRLKAECHVIQEREPRTLPEDQEMQLLLLKQNQIKILELLDETLTFLLAKDGEIKAALKNEEEINKRLRSMNNAFKTKLTSLAQEESTVTRTMTSEKVLKDMDSKFKIVCEMDKQFKNKLKHMLSTSKHIHTLEETLSKTAIKDSRDLDMHNFLPLRTVIGKLIEQSLNFPAQPYIEINERFWPQHIEFLLRFQMIVKDPHCPQKIKLVPFHL
ncbi:unnamed protein product [Lymnaea stagnalis]|uniref:Centromere protein K n=1 Tax=Lymnaea stagnalis TaxID=6523 RepID=A0AAV2H731_LYMST